MSSARCSVWSNTALSEVNFFCGMKAKISPGVGQSFLPLWACNGRCSFRASEGVPEPVVFVFLRPMFTSDPGKSGINAKALLIIEGEVRGFLFGCPTTLRLMVETGPIAYTLFWAHTFEKRVRQGTKTTICRSARERLFTITEVCRDGRTVQSVACRISGEIQRLLCTEKQHCSTWRPKKIRQVLMIRQRLESPLAVSSVGKVLKRYANFAGTP